MHLFYTAPAPATGAAAESPCPLGPRKQTDKKQLDFILFHFNYWFTSSKDKKQTENWLQFTSCVQSHAA